MMMVGTRMRRMVDRQQLRQQLFRLAAAISLSFFGIRVSSEYLYHTCFLLVVKLSFRSGFTGGGTGVGGGGCCVDGLSG